MADYIWPVPRGIGINQAFGSSPGGVNPSGGHTGMDFGTEVGTPVYAPADGVIEYAQWFTSNNGADNPYWITAGGGITVVLNSGAQRPTFVFSHLSSTAMDRGQQVRQGDVIGYTGNTGKWTTGPHLHFEALPPSFSLGSTTYGRVDPGLYCTAYRDQITTQGSKPKPIPSFIDMDIDMATPSEVVTALMGHDLTLRDGTTATLETHLVNLFGDTIKRTEKLTAFGGVDAGRVIDVLANLGPDVRAIKDVTDKLGKK